MAGIQVRALYEFTGEPGTAELSIVPGEILTLIRQDVGDGWWEGCNQMGQTGLFPAAYVEEVAVPASQPPAMPPPPLPQAYSELGAAEQDSWGVSAEQQHSSQQAYDGADYWDDEWDDDSEGGSTQQGNAASYPQGTVTSKSGSIGDVSSLGKFDGKGTVGKKNFNRFTSFVKSGVESYILGTLSLTVPEQEKVYIIKYFNMKLEKDSGTPGGREKIVGCSRKNIERYQLGTVARNAETEEGIVWNPISKPYTCQVASPKKESKLKGFKSFIAYQLTPTFNNIQVSRRYKHFDWLHERLQEKFSLIPVPPLPDKQISGRYEELFIEHRRMQLQAFVNCMCRHPVLSQCAVWEHFMTCTDEKMWKAGKRRAEKDELLGANYFCAIQAPERPIDVPTLEYETEKCSKFIHGMDSAVKNLMVTAVDQAKKHQGPYKREYQKIGQSFLTLGQVFEMDGAAGGQRRSLSEAVKRTGETYNEIGKLFEEQPKMDWEPLGDTLHIYKGILASFPDILAIHKGALQKRKECEKLTSDHKMDQTQLADTTRRTDVISYALLAEINHFHSERTIDFQKAMKSYLKEQINFYQKIVGELESALQYYEY